MKWEKTVFSSLFAEETRNGVYVSSDKHGFGVKIVNMGEVFSLSRIGGQQMSHVELSEQQTKRFLLKNGDLLFARRSLVDSGAGKASIVDGITEPTTFESSIIRVRLDQSRAVPLFYYYWLQSHNGRTAIRALVTGTNVKGIRASELKNIVVDYPPLDVQKRLADILSNYDNLIENNQKQIKLLEEAAQRLYQEWFVDLRFPGYEDAPIADGIPLGWRKTTLEDICMLNKQTLTPDKIPTDVPYIGLEHMPRRDICLCEWGNSAEVTSNKFVYQENDVLFGKIRPYFHKVGFALNAGVASTDSIIMRANENVWGLLLMLVSSDAFVDYTYQTCKEGAKMPRADWNQMKSYPVLVADIKVQRAFETNIASITQKIKVLAMQNRQLYEARDRLLPKLMSGEIEV